MRSSLLEVRYMILLTILYTFTVNDLLVQLQHLDIMKAVIQPINSTIKYYVAITFLRNLQFL
jgi:hypothetical protein